MNDMYPLCFKVVVDAGLVDPSRLASVSIGLEDRDQRGVLWEIGMSLACTNSDGDGSSGVRLSKEAEGFDPEGR